MRVGRMLCRLGRHRWKKVPGTLRLKHGAPMLECSRPGCGEVAWLVGKES